MDSFNILSNFSVALSLISKLHNTTSTIILDLLKSLTIVIFPYSHNK